MSRSFRPQRYQEIEGWFGRRDARFYRHQVRTAPPAAKFVEIGSWKGRSAYCMSEEIERSGKKIELCCVDTWQGSEEHDQEKAVLEGSLYEEFLTNIKPFRDRIETVRKPSVAAAEHFENGSLDFVFIDAAHDYENVLADIHAWRPKVKPGGVLGGHDYGDQFPGVEQAVSEVFGRNYQVFGGCWAFSEERNDLIPFYLPEFYTRQLNRLRKTWGKNQKAA